jgi:hypothetical protein
MADYQRQTFPFACRGINLSAPVDRLPPTDYRCLDNVRPYGTNRIQGRQGTTQVNAGTVPGGSKVHSLYSWNDSIPSPSSQPGAFSVCTRLAGIDTDLSGAVDPTNPASFEIIDTGFSGNPLSFVISESQFSSRPFCIVGDSSKMRKISSAIELPRQVGVAPPNFAPTTAFFGTGPGPIGPDIASSPYGYVYRLRARVSSVLNSGCISALGPAVRDLNALSPSSANATGPRFIWVTIPQAHPDPQVTLLDIFRWGGSLPVWKYIGTVSNTAGSTLLDIFSDLDIASNEEVDPTVAEDNQPFTSVDQTRRGTCTVTPIGTGLGATVTITSGDQFRAYNATGDNPFDLAGNQISLDGTLFTFYRSPDTATTVEILEDYQNPTTNVDFTVTLPEIMHQPLPCLWGPFGGGSSGVFVFAVGDALRPGAVYWTKGNHPESHPSSNVLDITSSAEPLMNGCIYSGNPYVFSTRRMFSLYPTLGQVTDFIALEVPNSIGLFAKWGLCVTPFGIVFIAKDGLYLFAGGAPVSLTNEDLYPIFRHEGFTDAALDLIDGLNGITGGFSAPDWSQPDLMKLAYGDGFLYWDYTDESSTPRTLVGQFDTSAGRFTGWISRDTHTPSVLTHYWERYEQGAKHGKTLMGTASSTILEYGGTADVGTAIVGRIRTGAFDTGDTRPRKRWGDVWLYLDSQCDVLDLKAGFDNFLLLSALATTGLNLTGERPLIGDVNDGLGQYARNLGLDISWSVQDGTPIFYNWVPTWIPKPELIALRATDWDDLGYPGAKFVQGFKLKADTLGVARTVEVLDDFNVAHAFTPALVNHPREQTIAYSFNTPFISHLVRLHPTDANFMRIEGVEWIFNPAPELVTTYTTQETTLDFEGWFSHRDIYLPVMSTATVTLTVIVNGNPASPFTYTFASTGGLYKKLYQILQPMKALEVQYSFTSSAGFRLFSRDLEIRVRQWSSTGPFLMKRPAGEVSRLPMQEARI